jgi:hypothetical protein
VPVGGPAWATVPVGRPAWHTVAVRRSAWTAARRSAGAAAGRSAREAARRSARTTARRWAALIVLLRWSLGPALLGWTLRPALLRRWTAGPARTTGPTLAVPGLGWAGGCGVRYGRSCGEGGCPDSDGDDGCTGHAAEMHGRFLSTYLGGCNRPRQPHARSRIYERAIRRL